MLRNIFAVVAGLCGMLLIVAATELAAAKLFPLPPGFDVTDPANVKAFFETVPLSVELLVVAGWWLGAFAGAGGTARIAKTNKLVLAMLIGVFVAASAIAYAVRVPHPDWMTVTGVLGPLVMAWIAQRLAVAPEPVLPTD